MYLRFHSKYVHNRMHVILHICCQIQHTSVALGYVDSGPCEVQRNCSFSYKLLYIQIHASPLLLEMYRQYDLPRIPNFLQIKPISSNWRYVHSGPVKPNATAVLHYQT